MSAPAAHTNRPAGTGRVSSAQSTRQQLDELDALLQRMLDLPVNKEAALDDEATVGAAEPEPQRTPLPPTRVDRPQRERSEARPPVRRSYPPSYMVVETSTPPLPEAPGPTYPAGVDSPPAEEPRDALFESGAEQTDDPIGDLARLRARLESQDGDWVPLRSSWQPSAQTWKPLAETWQQAARAIPDPPPQPPAPPTWNAGGEERAATSEVPAAPPAPVPAAPGMAPDRPAALLPLVWFNQAFDVCLYPLGPLGSWLKRPSGRSFLGAVGLLCLLAAGALAAACWAGIEGLDGLAWTR